MDNAAEERQQEELNLAPELQKKTFEEECDLLYKNIFISVPTSFICSLIVFIALYRIPHTIWLEYWLIANFVISFLRLFHALRYVSNPQVFQQHYAQLYFYYFIFLTTCSALLWGIAGSVLMPHSFHVEQMIVIVVLSGIAAGGIQSLASSLSACIIFISFLILPLAGWIFLHAEVSYTILGLSVLLYFLFNLGIAIRSNKFLKQTLKLKHSNIGLAENLSTRNKLLIQMNQEIQEKENNLQLIQDHAPIGMAIVSIEGKWLSVNNKLCDIVGYNKAELENMTIQDITFEEDLETDVDNRTKLLSGTLQAYETEKRFVNKNNQVIWIDINVSLVRGKKNEPLYYISQIQDINERKQNETIFSLLSKMNAMLQLCRDSDEAYHIITHNAAEIFQDISGGLAIFNKALEQLEVVGTWGEQPLLRPSFKSEDCWGFRSGNVYIVNDPKKDANCHHYIHQPLNTSICIPLIAQSQVLGMLHFNSAADQEISSYQQEVINNFCEIIKVSLSNIQLKEVLHEQAIHDTLTGLYNRRYLYEVLPRLLQTVVQTNKVLAVCMLDIDFFKQINDKYGHDAGDEVLSSLGKLLKTNFRESDIAFRIGGEEFIITLKDSDQEKARIRMKEFVLAVSKLKIQVQNKELPPITLSIGIAEAPAHGETLNQILASADLALYTAKETGRNKIVNFSEVKESN